MDIREANLWVQSTTAQHICGDREIRESSRHCRVIVNFSPRLSALAGSLEPPSAKKIATGNVFLNEMSRSLLEFVPILGTRQVDPPGSLNGLRSVRNPIISSPGETISPSEPRLPSPRLSNCFPKAKTHNISSSVLRKDCKSARKKDDHE